jgi:hypothetical protein
VAASYKNLSLMGPSAADIVALLRARARSAYVSPTSGGLTVVFDKAADEDPSIAQLASLSRELSEHFSCPALAVAVYVDALLLALYREGTLVGEFESTRGGDLDAGRLRDAFAPARARFPIWSVLHLLPYRFESSRHRDLIRALGMPRWAHATGYHRIKHEQTLPPGLDPAELQHTLR